MPISAIAAVQALRDEQRRLRHGGMVSRFWGLLRSEWQRWVDRATTQAW
ncbi:MAG TPA: hypothetical protein VMB73_26160 [Acetobacteraceae bacterium]|jgi:hypothetical protein|nr:hypothetical protein [Acetobacteraceae bacterium]